MSDVIKAWHRIVDAQDASAMDDLLSDEVVFHSPVVHTPQRGKRITKLYLMAAMQVLNATGHFRYCRELVDGNHAVLEFETQIGDVTVNGVDMIEWNDAGQVVDFKVMVRPLKAINAIHQAMGTMLESMKPKS
ncbi:MAG TPA: nuclear transport factor 2 family protein [Pseudomonas xinjiangensis]|uniref:Nuclear transport factor 2 family protein n=2 Tax=root TaxID=1 RepID=A0A7V1BKY5_9GAMM|nr:nuclear transport factor 2 family protein [Halopseudomonas xinjiangensis]HEC47429.1 nuclear transport factor 2 family protein [Halopseudomonas xinjiangensis]